MADAADALSPATSVGSLAPSPTKKGWLWRSNSKDSKKGSSPRTPSSIASTFFTKTPLTHPIEQENAALEALREKIATEPTEWHFWLDHSYEDQLRRTLRAHSCDAERGFHAWQHLSRWRAEYKPENLTEADVPGFMAKGVVTKCGRDRRGRPATFVDAKKHKPDPDNMEETMKAVIYLFESETRESSKTADGMLTIILDNGGVGRKNLDTHLFISKGGVIHTLQDYYPDRLGTCLIINGSWIFRAFWAIISPFLNAKTRARVKVLSRPDDLLQYFDRDSLPPQVQQQLKTPAST